MLRGIDRGIQQGFEQRRQQQQREEENAAQTTIQGQQDAARVRESQRAVDEQERKEAAQERKDDADRTQSILSNLRDPNATDAPARTPSQGGLQLKDLSQSEPSPTSAPPPAAAPKKQAARSLPIIPCDPNAPPAAPGEGSQLLCTTLSCGGTNEAGVCCPKGYAYLDTTDCQCYRDTADIKHSSYAACKYFQPN